MIVNGGNFRLQQVIATNSYCTIFQFPHQRQKGDTISDTSYHWYHCVDRLNSHSDDIDSSIDMHCSNLLQERKTRIIRSRAGIESGDFEGIGPIQEVRGDMVHGYSNLCMKFKLSELTPDSTPGHAWPTGVCIDLILQACSKAKHCLCMPLLFEVTLFIAQLYYYIIHHY